MPDETYDALVIGSGQGGTPLARDLPRHGWRTALVERGLVGGTCVNTGCTPTKTMVASAEVADRARRAAEYGVRTGPVSVDMGAVRERKAAVVTQFREGNLERLNKTDGLDLIRGSAHFVAEQTVEVRLADGGTRRITAPHIFIDTGSRPRIPSIPGLDRVPYFDSTRIMELDALPAHLLIVGGGYVGLEFAQMFCRFGSSVTVVQRGAQLLPREDEDFAGEILSILREDGIRVLLRSELVRAEPGADGAVRAVIQTPEGEEALEASHLLLAVGRAPNVEDLDLPAAGIETDEGGHIRVNDRLETNVPGIYALGDVKGGPAFTHISYDDFRVLRTNLLEGGQASTAGRLVPQVVFTDPQLARVGLTEREAREQGRAYRLASMPMSSVARATESGQTRGLMKALVDPHNDRILGFAVLGMDGGELMGAVQLAMMGGLRYTALRDGIFAHPTLIEALNNLFFMFNED